MEKQKLFFLYSEKSIGEKNKPISLWCACACMSTCQFTYRQEKKRPQSKRTVCKKKKKTLRLQTHPSIFIGFTHVLQEQLEDAVDQRFRSSITLHTSTPMCLV